MTAFLDTLLSSIAQPAVRLSRAGKILAWNAAAEAELGALAKRKAIAPLLPTAMRAAVEAALASDDAETVLTGARVVRVSARERVLLLDAPQAAVFDVMPIPALVWHCDEDANTDDLRLVAANFISEKSGPNLPLRQLIGRRRADVGPNTALDTVYERVMRTGERAVVTDIVDGDGQPFHANVFPVPGNRMAVTFESVSSTRRAERGYRTIFERSHDAIILIDPATETVLQANPAAVELYKRDPLVGTTVAQLSRNYRPGMSQHILAKGFLRFETTHVRGDGQDLHLDANTTVIDYEGRPMVLGMMRDITSQIAARAALAASEEKYRSLVANAPVVIWTSDAHNPIVFASQSLTLVTGFAPEELTADVWLSRLHEDDVELCREAYAATFERRELHDIEYRFCRKDNTWAWFHELASRVYEHDGTLLADGVTIDITDRKEAELELARREAQLAEAQSITHIGSMEIDLENGHVDWSDEMYRIAGLEPQSRPITVDLVAQLVPAEVIANLTHELIEQEHVMYRVDGSVRTVLSRAKRVADPSGNTRIVGTVQDVTERREAELALRRHERRLQFIVSRLPVLLWSTDAELRVDSLIGAGFEQASDPTLGALSLTVRDLVGSPDPQNEPELAISGQSVAFDTVHGERELRVYVEPLRNEQGVVTGTAGIAFDRTRERRAERANEQLVAQLHDAAEEWRHTFDSIRAPLVIVDSEGAICRMNSAALAHSRFTDYGDAIGQPAAAAGEASIWKEIDAIGRSASSHQTGIALQGVDHDGRSWDLLASPSRGGQVIVIATEVTELVRMQDKLRRTERMSEMGALVAGVAHEVRNPLFGLSATLDAFEARFGSEQFSGYVSALREQVDRMSQLMHELLEYGRPIAATLEENCIGGVVSAAVASTTALAQKRGVTLRSTLPASVAKVKMDQPRMQQVFENLLTNAIQHSSENGGVEISHVVDAHAVTILVEDRGPGFRDDDLTRIFEPFFTRRRDGTGLGLSLVRRIVEEHNGRVMATNREGGGAAVLVSLPVSAGEGA